MLLLQLMDIEMIPQNKDQSNIKDSIFQDAQPLNINLCTLVAWISIVLLSTVVFGCTMTLIPATSLELLQSYYQIQGLNEASTLSILNGILPLGGLTGCFFYPIVIRYIAKSKLKYITSLAVIISSLISMIPSFPTLLIGKYMLGFSCAFELGFANSYFRELAPPYYRSSLGAYYSFARTFGSFLSFVVSYPFINTTSGFQNILVFLVPVALAIIQCILFFIFLPFSPVELIRKNQLIEAEQQLSNLYPPESVKVAVVNLKKQFIAPKVTEIKSVTDIITQIEGKQKNRKIALFMAIHIAFMRQMCGQTYVVVYAKQTMKRINVFYADLTPIIVIGAAMVGGLIGMFLAHNFGRRRLLAIGTIACCLGDVWMGIADEYNSFLFELLGMSIFMLACSMFLAAIAWIYPNQIIPIPNRKFASMASWSGGCLITIVPPYVVEITKGNQPYPIFYFLAVYLFICTIINYLFLIQTKNIPYDEIVRRFGLAGKKINIGA